MKISEHLCLLTFTFVFTVLTCEPILAAPSLVVFPGETWETRAPTETGMDGGKLEAFAARVGGDGVIIKNGFLVKSWGKATARKDWASAAKPVLSTLLLLAVKEEKLASVDVLVKDAGWALVEKDETMTYRHLANMDGFDFWFNEFVGDSGQRTWPALPADAYQANGMWNRDTVTVLPSLRMVVAVRGAKLGPFEPGKEDGAANQNLRLLVESCGANRAGNTESESRTPGKSKPLTRELGHLGSFVAWRRIEINLTGPESQSRDEPNPFNLGVEGVFIAPNGKRWKIPGFFDGDGNGDPNGSVWKVRFSGDEPGEWTFASRSAEPSLDGWTAKFTVIPAPADAPGIYRWGRLEAVGSAADEIRYLKFRDGPYWLKAGCDDPENFLGKSSNYDTNAKRMAAIDYLQAKGINSLYIMTHNLGGDDKDVWPWIGGTQKEAKAYGAANARFDVAKLAEWLELFEHMQARGMVTYLVLEDDSAWKGYDHVRYYREILARFGHLPGLIFNFNEEYNENYSLPDALAFMRVLKDLDAYNHPRGIHNVNLPDNTYVDAPQIDFTSIQTGSPGRKAGDGLNHNQLVIDWIQRSRERGQRVLMVGVDEGRPEEERQAWWTAYLGGGVWEAHLKPPYDRPMSAWETLWTELGGTRAFMELMPFWEMHPANEIVKSGTAFCMAKLGEVYALYLPEGGQVEVDLSGSHFFNIAWWSPTNGRLGRLQSESRTAGGRVKLNAPGADDWAVRIVREQEPGTSSP